MVGSFDYIYKVFDRIKKYLSLLGNKILNAYIIIKQQLCKYFEYFTEYINILVLTKLTEILFSTGKSID